MNSELFSSNISCVRGAACSDKRFLVNEGEHPMRMWDSMVFYGVLSPKLDPIGLSGPY